MAADIGPNTPHSEVQDELRKRIYDTGGATCPTCTQHAQVYRRKINSGMAVSLIKMLRAGADEHWVHVPTVIGARSREEGKLAYWGLVEEELSRREDGGRAGYWRLTSRGRLFAQAKISLPKYAEVYNGRCLGLDSQGGMANIRDALGTKFSYEDLMAGR